MWEDTREGLPKKDGDYIVQFVTGRVGPLPYTTRAGWNSYIDKNGEVLGGDDFDPNNTYVVRWFDVPAPPPISEERYEEWINE